MSLVGANCRTSPLKKSLRIEAFASLRIRMIDTETSTFVQASGCRVINIFCCRLCDLESRSVCGDVRSQFCSFEALNTVHRR
jgi:hypothetical protein